MKLRLAVLQINSALSKSQYGILKQARPATEVARELASSIPPNPDNIPQLIVLSEFALSPYNFPSKASLLPHCEELGCGPNFSFAKELSLKHASYTLLGYPEKARDKLYNSAMLLSPKGEVVFNYRKTHLYETDEYLGISESDVGFQSFSLDMNDKILKTSIGICMDLNPYKFEAPFEKWEFGNHCKDNDVDLVLCPMAWLQMESPSITGQKKDLAKELGDVVSSMNTTLEYKGVVPPSETLDYWYKRLVPLFDLKDKKIIVVVANRSGFEYDVLYCGTSCIMQLDTATKTVNFLGYLGWKDEGLLFREVDI